MTTVTPRPLMLLLVVVISFVATAHTKALKCLNAETSTKNKPVIFDLNQQPVRSIRFTAPTNAPWDAVIAFGEQKDATEDFTTLINMEIKKKKQDAKIYPLKLYRQTRNDMLLDERISNVWLDNGGQAIIHISNNKSSFSITFINDDREFLMELIDPEITGINSVQVNGDLEVASCEDLDRFPETTTTTTSTTTTKPTTTSTTTTTTTTTTSTTPSTTTITTTLPITTTVPVTSAIPTRVFLTTLDTLNATDDQLLYTEAEAVIGLGGSMDCKIVPVWAWACAGLAVVFFLFILGLLAF